MTPSRRIDANDAEARRRISHSLDESLVVEASAGTGKTTELVNRIVEVLKAGRSTVDKIVAVTFTHKAAGELKIRVRQKLDEERAKPDIDLEARLRLENALEELEEAAIGTIHGFCAQILRSRPVEAHIDPAFEELTEGEAARIFDRAFSRWFQQQLDTDSPGLRRALARLAWREDWESGPAVEQLKMAGRKLAEWRDFTALWQPEAYDRNGAVDALVAGARTLWNAVSACARATDALVQSLRPLRDLLGWIDRGRVSDHDTLEAVLLKLGRDLKRGGFRKGSGFFSTELSREAVVSGYESFQQCLEQFRVDSGVLLACQLQQEMRPLLDGYADLKRRTGRLDFVDLLLLTRDLVKNDASVRRYLQERFTHIFVDEFQDTDPLQAEILLLLSASDPEETDWMQAVPEPGKLFLVGDPKQSIYKFRRADVSLYRQLSDRLAAQGTGRAYLTESYRSVSAIKQFVNAAFETEMAGDVESAQARYSPLEEDGRAIPEQPAIVALPAPKPYGSRKVTKTAINACLPATVAAFVQWLLGESGWKVHEKGSLVPVREGHVCILFRRFLNFHTDLTRDYVRALEARNIAHLLVGSKSFHGREEVDAIRTALNAIEWPEDELSVYATLRGALFAITDGVLLRFRHEYKKLHPWRRYPEDVSEDLLPVVEALRVLADLNRRRNVRPVADTVNKLLDSARAHAAFAVRPGGRQALANVYRICDLARQYELSGGFSFRGFVEQMNDQAEKTEAPEAPVLEEAADGVRLMTVHTAKGLEFPVVILADMTANLCSQEPDRYIDPERSLCATRLLRCAPRELIEHETLEHAREQAEGVRVCYVAATRARDLLVVPAIGDEQFSGWLGPLNKALYPGPKAYRLGRPYAGCTGDRTVLERPYNDSRESSVRPGLHKPECGAHEVLWFDPAVLDLNVPEKFGLPQIDLLKAEGAAERSLQDYRRWQEDRRAVLDQASAETVRVFRVTELTDDPPAAPVAIERAREDGPRARGARFGTLLHAVLRDARWNAGPAELERLAALHAVICAATPREQADAAAAAAVVLRHPLLARAAASARSHRELPITFRLSATKVLEGVIDLAWVENGRWHVIDYKAEDQVAKYEKQLGWYIHALSSMTGMPADGTLLQV